MPKPAELPVEDLPVSPRAREILHQVATVRHRSELGKFSGRVLFHEVVKDKTLTHGEMTIIQDEVAARKDALTVSTGQIPPELPEPTVVVDKPWSPTDILDTMPHYELDGKQRAAGDHLDLDRD